MLYVQDPRHGLPIQGFQVQHYIISAQGKGLMISLS